MGRSTNITHINNQIEMSDIDLRNASLGVENSSYRFAIETRNLLDATYISLRDPLRSVYGDPREIRLVFAIAFGSEERGGRALE